jgi:hypothetical protein
LSLITTRSTRKGRRRSRRRTAFGRRKRRRPPRLLLLLLLPPPLPPPERGSPPRAPSSLPGRPCVKLLESAEPILAELEALDERLSDPNITAHYVSQMLLLLLLPPPLPPPERGSPPRAPSSLPGRPCRNQTQTAPAPPEGPRSAKRSAAAEKQLEEEQVGAAVAAAADDDEAKAKPNGKRNAVLRRERLLPFRVDRVVIKLKQLLHRLRVQDLR